MHLVRVLTTITLPNRYDRARSGMARETPERRPRGTRVVSAAPGRNNCKKWHERSHPNSLHANNGGHRSRGRCAQVVSVFIAMLPPHLHAVTGSLWLCVRRICAETSWLHTHTHTYSQKMACHAQERVPKIGARFRNPARHCGPWQPRRQASFGQRRCNEAETRPRCVNSGQIRPARTKLGAMKIEHGPRSAKVRGGPTSDESG